MTVLRQSRNSGGGVRLVQEDDGMFSVQHENHEPGETNWWPSCTWRERWMAEESFKDALTD